MDEEFSNEFNNDSQSEYHPDQDEIPPWLQGLEDPEDVEDKDSRPSKAPEDQWIKEVDKNDLREHELPGHFEESESFDQDLPEWLHEMTLAETVSDDTIINAPVDSQAPSEELNASNHEIIQVDHPPEGDVKQPETQADIPQEIVQDLNQEPPSDTQSDKGFIEISEFKIQKADELKAEKHGSTVQSDKVLSDEFSPSQELALASEKNAQQDSPTQPVPVMQEEDELLGAIQTTESSLPTTPAPETWHEVVEDETITVSEDYPGDLEQAQVYIKDMKFSEAANIFRQYIEQASYLPEIELILEESRQDQTKVHSTIWELSGDIALKTNHPEDAIYAYTKAIHALLYIDRAEL